MIWKLSFKNVLRNGRRTAITVAVVAVGVSMLLLALGYVEFMKWGLAETFIHRQTGHFQITTTRSLTAEEERILEFGLEPWEELIDRMESVEHVEVAAPRIYFSGLAATGEKSNVALVTAADPEKEIILGGEFIDPEPLRRLLRHDDAVILGSGLAALLHVVEGDDVTLMTTTADGALNAMDFRFAGTITVFSEELDSRFALIPLVAAQDLLATRKVRSILVGLDATENLAAVVRQARPLVGGDLTLRLWREVSPYFDKVLGFFHQLIGFLAPVLMLIVWFSSMNTVMMSILERSAELASLRAMGTSKSTLIRMLLTEGLWLGVIGVVAGVLLELVLTAGIRHADIMVPPPPGQSSGYPLEVRNVASNFILVGGVTTLVVSLSTVIPALRIAQTNIVKALRR